MPPFPSFDNVLLGKRHEMVQGIWDHMTTVAWPQMFGDAIDEEKVLGIRPMMTSEMLDQTDAAWLEKVVIAEESIDATDFHAKASAALKLFVYTPKAVSVGPRKCIVWFHGGGFILSEASHYHRKCSKMAAEWDAVVVSVDIGVAPEIKAPHCNALRHVARHLALYRIDRFHAYICIVAIGAALGDARLCRAKAHDCLVEPPRCRHQPHCAPWRELRRLHKHGRRERVGQAE